MIEIPTGLVLFFLAWALCTFLFIGSIVVLCEYVLHVSHVEPEESDELLTVTLVPEEKS